MKTLKIFFIALFTAFTFTACHAQRELSEVSKLEGVQSIYIGKAMLKMAKGAAAAISKLTVLMAPNSSTNSLQSKS